jgi:alkyl sulfatase BDS1-like metallo-beta-lactamase superfamily hydrolase
VIRQIPIRSGSSIQSASADPTIDTDPATLDAVLWKRRSVAHAQRSGTMTIEGDKAAVERFLRLFPMPEPAAPAGPA